MTAPLTLAAGPYRAELTAGRLVITAEGELYADRPVPSRIQGVRALQAYVDLFERIVAEPPGKLSPADKLRLREHQDQCDDLQPGEDECSPGRRSGFVRPVAAENVEWAPPGTISLAERRRALRRVAGE